MNTEIPNIHTEARWDVDFLAQIRKEIASSLDVVQNRREVFRQDLRDYVSQEIDDEIIGVNTLYAIVNLYLAVNISDELDIIAEPRHMGYEEYADNITANARWDMKEMEYHKKEYQREWDKAMFGVGIMRKTGWDSEKSIPLVEVCDPMNWLPDPEHDYLTKPRFSYFEREVHKSEITKENGYLIDAMDAVGEIPEIEATKWVQRESSNLWGDIKQDGIVHIYDGLSYWNDELYIVTVNAGCTEFLRKEKVSPVTETEKKTKRVEIDTVLNCKWFSPKRGNPFGVSLADLMRDKQFASKMLLNLRLSNAKFATYGQLNLVNVKMVKDTKELTRPSVNTKFIGVNTEWADISQAIYPVPRPQIGQDSYAVAEEISRQLQLDTGIDANTMGVGGVQWSQTLWEAQQVQANANLRMSLWIEIGNWAEQEFWEKIWYRSYLEFFGKNDKKMIRIAGNFSTSFIELNYHSFQWGSAIEFTIESKRKIKALQEGMRANFMAKLPMVLQDPNVPQISKNIAQRYAYKLDGMSREMQYLLVPKTADELSAEEKIKYINEEMEYGAEIDNLDEDHMTYIVLFHTARDVPMKQKAIANRKQAYILWKQQQQMQAMWPPQNTAVNASASASAAQLTNAAISQQNDPITLNSL